MTRAVLLVVHGQAGVEGGLTDEPTHPAARYDHVGWFITESKKDIAGVQKKGAPVTSVLLETKFSGEGRVHADTPVWKLDVK